MRRSHIALTAGVALIASALPGQESDGSAKIELDKLRTPTSPAFSLLGVNPSVIARPSTPRALATEFVSSSNKGTLIPNNYAAEFAPFWLVPRPTLTYDAFKQPSTAQSIAQTFSISLATSRPDTGSDSSLTLVALGARMIPVMGSPSARFLRSDTLLTKLQSVWGDSLRAYLHATTEKDSTRLSKFLDAQSDSMSVVAKAMGSEERVGFFLELAGAVAAAYPNESFDDGKFSRLGLWGTWSYRADSPRIDFITLLRFMRNLRDDGQNALDAGGRIHWLQGNLGLSAEWVSRTAFQLASSTPVPGITQHTLTFASSSRAVGIVDYRAADQLYITMSFGQDYKALGETRHPLVAKLGLQFSHGQKPVIKR